MLIARNLILTVLIFFVALLIAAAMLEVVFGEPLPSFVPMLTIVIAFYPLFYIWKKK